METAVVPSVRFAPTGSQLLKPSGLQDPKGATSWCGSLQRGAYKRRGCQQPRNRQNERPLFHSRLVWGCHFLSGKQDAHVFKVAATRNVVVAQGMLGEFDQVSVQSPSKESGISAEHLGAEIKDRSSKYEENVRTQSLSSGPSSPAVIPPPSTTATSPEPLTPHPLESEAPVQVLLAGSAVNREHESTLESFATPEALHRSQGEVNAEDSGLDSGPTTRHGSIPDGKSRVEAAENMIESGGSEGGSEDQFGQSVSDLESATPVESASLPEQVLPQSGGEKKRKKPPPDKYVWPELRNTESQEPNFEYLTVDPSEIPERRKSSLNTSSSGRATRYMAPGPEDQGPEKRPSVKREPSTAAQKCLTLLSEYKDPVNLPYEEFRETLNAWAAEHEPRRSDGMDVLRTLLDCQETRVFIRAAEHFLTEPWFKATVTDHNKLLDVFVKNQLFLKAENRFRKMPVIGVSPNVTTYNLMLHHYGLWKKVDRAEEIFLEMKTKGLRPNEDTYVALMGALTRAGRLVEAERLLKSMRKSRCPRGPSAYVTLMEAYGREEEPEEAERIFLMIRADGIPRDRAAYLGLMHVYAEIHKPHMVERVFREMLSKRVLPDETTYLVLIDSYRKAGLGKNCERLMEEMKLFGLSPYKAAAMIMEAYGMEQLFSEAERILIDLELKTGHKPGVMHYNALLASYGRHGLHKDAMKVFDWMTEAGVALNQRSHVLILDLFDRTGRKANLRAAFRTMQSDGFGLEYEAASEAVQEYRQSLGAYALEEEEIRAEKMKAKMERANKFMEKWDTWSRELDELDREIAEVELAAERRMDKWESRTRT